VTPVLVLLDAALTLASGAALCGLVRTRLRLLERSLVAIVAGVVIGAAMTYGLALALGLNVGTVLAGPAITGVAAVVIGQFAGNPLRPWIDAWNESRARWQSRAPLFVATVAGTVAAAGIFAAIFAHTIFQAGGSLEAGYSTVWADWSQHLTTEASFAVASNLPPVNPLLSGTPLLYPFLPDFHAATLMTLGLSPGAALAIPGAVLALVCALLVVALAMRLGLGAGAGVVAAVICFIGGGLGFVGVFGDACTNHGFAASQCTLPYVLTHPGDALPVIGGTLRDLPGVISAQPRAYDALLTAAAQKTLPNLQWYTPLLAWWLPQRTILYGFSAALSALIVVFAARGDGRRSAWGAFGLAGVLLGLLPLVHVQTLIAAGVILLVLLLVYPRVEWVALIGAAAVIAGPRMLQLLLGPHGSSAFGNAYPWIEPGWLANNGAEAAPGGGPAEWWRFWVFNLGVAVPLSAIVVIAAALRLMPSRVGAIGRRLTSPFPAPLLSFFLATMLIFIACNFIVFQSWDWDNTKLLVYWYLAVALLVGALAASWWRRWWRGVAAFSMVGSVVLTGVLVGLRLLPWTPSDRSITGPYEIASADERALASTIETTTAKDAVFLTFGRPNDPLLALAGRTGVMGYYGWLWSYGVDFGTRYDDVRRMYQGCGDPTSCPIPGLLRRYHISYVEIDDRLQSAGAIEPAAGLDWWRSQGFNVVGRADHIVVYEVRSGG
jgi:hypothetical protein